MSAHLRFRHRGRSFAYDHGGNCPCYSRRALLAGVGAIGVAAALSPAAVEAEAVSSTARVVDVHHHIYPPRYLSDNGEMIAKTNGAFAARIKDWSTRGAVDRMDQAGVATAINSMTSPGVWFEDGDAARARARLCNEFGAHDFPGRFGMFAAIPLPDTEAA